MAKKSLFLENITVAEVREALKSVQTVVIPLGCTEQHGYHLPLNTDSLIATRISQDATSLAGCFLAPTVPYTFSGGELPGTINISPHVLALYLREIARSFADMGMKKIVFLTGHGGTENMRDIQEGLKMFLRLEKSYRDVSIFVVTAWEFSKAWQGGFDNRDFHAAKVETSLMSYLAPDTVRPEMTTDKKEILEMMLDNPDSYQAFTQHTEHEQEIPHVNQHDQIEVGVMGYPEDSSAELGKQIFDEGVAGMVEFLKSL